jgi:hypothetical protein
MAGTHQIESTELPRGVTQIRLAVAGRALTVDQVRQDWLGGGRTLSALRQVIAEAGAAMWETRPCPADQAAGQAFEFVLVPEPRLAQRRADSSAFAGHFGTGQAVAFDSLRGDARLVAPTPDADDDAAHLASFAASASGERWAALWRTVAEEDEAARRRGQPWLSTAGLGVPWLHVRFDVRPKYYRHDPYRVLG